MTLLSVRSLDDCSDVMLLSCRRISEVLNIASKLNRKVSFLGRSLEVSFNIARKWGISTFLKICDIL